MVTTISNFHLDSDEKKMIRWLENESGKLEYQEMLTSGSLVDYNKGGYNNVDCSDSAYHSAISYNKRSSRWWQIPLWFVISQLLVVQAWLVWRVLHPE